MPPYQLIQKTQHISITRKHDDKHEKTSCKRNPAAPLQQNYTHLDSRTHPISLLSSITKKKKKLLHLPFSPTQLYARTVLLKTQLTYIPIHFRLSTLQKQQPPDNNGNLKTCTHRHTCFVMLLKIYTTSVDSTPTMLKLCVLQL